MTAESFYKYLGIETWSHGTKTNFIKKLDRKLDDLRRAPLKPQQRIWILQTYCISSLYHQSPHEDNEASTGWFRQGHQGTVRQFMRMAQGHIQGDLPR